MRVLLAAVPGSGKTTIVDLVKKKMPGLRVANVGGIMYEIAKKRLGVRSRDDMRKRLTVAMQKRFQLEAARRVSKMRGDLLMDSHAAIKTPKGFITGISRKTAPLLRPDIIVLLEYRPKDIIDRRRGDRTRTRDHDPARVLEDHQTISREFAVDAAESIDAAVRVIDLRYPQRRPFEHTKVAASEIVKLFKPER